MSRGLPCLLDRMFLARERWGELTWRNGRTRHVRDLMTDHNCLCESVKSGGRALLDMSLVCLRCSTFPVGVLHTLAFCTQRRHPFPTMLAGSTVSRTGRPLRWSQIGEHQNSDLDANGSPRVLVVTTRTLGQLTSQEVCQAGETSATFWCDTMFPDRQHHRRVLRRQWTVAHDRRPLLKVLSGPVAGLARMDPSCIDACTVIRHTDGCLLVRVRVHVWEGRGPRAG